MESHGEGVDPVSPKPRYKVLRAGVRIVADQFPPYDETPWERSEQPYLVSVDPTTGEPLFFDPATGRIVRNIGTQIHRAMLDLPRQFGKNMQAIEEGIKGMSAPALWTDEAASQIIPLPSSDHDSPTVTNFKNDGQTFKRPKQDIPFYVELERRKRR